MYPNPPSDNPNQLPPQPAPQPMPQQQAPSPFAGNDQPMQYGQPAQVPQPAQQQPYSPYATAPQQSQQPMTQPQPAPSYGHQAYPGTSPHAAGDKKTTMFVIAAVVVLAVGALGYYVFANLGKGSNSPLASVAGGNSDVVSRNDGKLDLSGLIDTSITIKDQDLKAKINQQVNLSSGLSYMVTKVDRNWTAATGSYLKADANKELIKVTVVVGNKAKSGSQYVSDSLFKLLNSAGGYQDSELASKDDTPDILDGQDVAPGKQTTGAIVFQVDKGEAVSLATDDKYQRIGGTSGSKEVTLKSEVALQ